MSEEIFDKSSDRIVQLVNKFWLSRYPRCRYLVYYNGNEFKLNFQYLCDSYGINSLTAMDAHERPLFIELRGTVVSCRVFIRSQSLIAR
jgi:hypothetical protein